MSNLTLCHCGTCQEAIKAAHDQLKTIMENDCVVWAFQISVAMSLLMRYYASDNGEAAFIMAADEMVKEVREYTKRGLTVNKPH
jgi:hypothetical protein